MRLQFGLGSTPLSDNSIEVWRICFQDGSLTHWEVIAGQVWRPGALLLFMWVSPRSLGFLTAQWLDFKVKHSKREPVRRQVTFYDLPQKAHSPLLPWRPAQVLGERLRLCLQRSGKILEVAMKWGTFLQSFGENILLCIMWLFFTMGRNLEHGFYYLQFGGHNLDSKRLNNWTTAVCSYRR